MTITRDIILEIMEQAPKNQFKKSGLVQEVQKAAEVGECEIVDEEGIKALIDNICILKSNRHYALK